jgi:hypothetical protein
MVTAQNFFSTAHVFNRTPHRFENYSTVFESSDSFVGMDIKDHLIDARYTHISHLFMRGPCRVINFLTSFLPSNPIHLSVIPIISSMQCPQSSLATLLPHPPKAQEYERDEVLQTPSGGRLRCGQLEER